MVLNNNKGITPIIAVILLLMMTIAIGGLAYVWIQRLQTNVQSTSENTTTALSGTFKVLLRVEGYNTSCGGTSNWAIARIVYKNAGVEATKNVRIYVDDSLRTESDVINGNATLGAGVTTWAQLGNETCSNWVNRTRKITIRSDESETERLITFNCGTAFGGAC